MRFAGALLLLVLTSTAFSQSSGITLEHFGVGDHARPGDTIGIKLSVAANLDRPTPVEVVWELPDGNGDIAQVSRRIVLSPGELAPIWLYARLPARTPASATLDDITVIRVFEERNGARLRLLTSARISGTTSASPSVAVECEEDLIGVVGNGRMGLDVFATPWPGTSTIPSMNSLTKIARGIRCVDLPDSWQGLSSFSAIIWTQETPQSLSGDAAKALRDWIFRGGNFIVVLPDAAEPWGVITPAQHPLSDLVPRWRTQRHDAVPVAEVLPLVTIDTALRNRRATVPLTVFTEPATNDPFDGLLMLPTTRDPRTGLPAPRADSLEGSIVAVRRDYGHGHVTFLGLDIDGLTKRSLTVEGLPEADIFWNRLLGRRADTPSMSQYRAMNDASPPQLVTRSIHLDDMGRGELVAQLIGMRGQAALGILGAFVLFLLYWALAGPGGYAILAWRRMQHHAWLSFSLVALVFATGIWAIGGAISTSAVRVQHLTVLDSIWRSADQERPGERILQRATCWFSAFLPGYGTATVAVGSGDADRNTVVSWSQPPAGSDAQFPNPAIARVPVATPWELTVASRATSASFESAWVGSVPRAWGRLPYASDSARPLVQRVVSGDPPRVQISGVIEHQLPSTLRNVSIVHVWPLRSEPPVRKGPFSLHDPSAQLPNHGRYFTMAEWAPGVPIEVATILNPAGAMGSDEVLGSLAAGITARFNDPFQGVLSTLATTLVTAAERDRALEMLGLYGMLDPPLYVVPDINRPGAVRHVRMLGRSIDLSLWFTRPCLIISGILDAAECPVDVRVNGEQVPSQGMVVVRTVFPLPTEPEFAAPTAR